MSDCAGCKRLQSEVHGRDKEIERLRARTHEIAEEGDARRAKLERAHARMALEFQRARDRVMAWTADWTTDPPSQKPGGWWRYTSHNHAYEATVIVGEWLRMREAIHHASYLLNPNQGERPKPEWADRWLRTTLPADHPNRLDPEDDWPCGPPTT